MLSTLFVSAIKVAKADPPLRLLLLALSLPSSYVSETYLLLIPSSSAQLQPTVPIKPLPPPPPTSLFFHRNPTFFFRLRVFLLSIAYPLSLHYLSTYLPIKLTLSRTYHLKDNDPLPKNAVRVY